MNNTDTSPETCEAKVPAGEPVPRDADEICQWLVEYVASTLKVNATSVDIDSSFASFSMDSLLLVVLTEDLSSWLGRQVDPVAPFEHPSIRQLALSLAV